MVTDWLTDLTDQLTDCAQVPVYEYVGPRHLSHVSVAYILLVAKYLGITISDKLDWSPHIDFITSKASNTLSFLRRNLRSCSQSLRELAYISLVRSQLDYAAATWDPYQVGHTQKIERIQRRAARFVCNNYSYYSSVTSMISTLGWADLASRRKGLCLALF